MEISRSEEPPFARTNSRLVGCGRWTLARACRQWMSCTFRDSPHHLQLRKRVCPGLRVMERCQAEYRTLLQQEVGDSGMTDDRSIDSLSKVSWEFVPALIRRPCPRSAATIHGALQCHGLPAGRNIALDHAATTHRSLCPMLIVPACDACDQYMSGNSSHDLMIFLKANAPRNAAADH